MKSSHWRRGDKSFLFVIALLASSLAMGCGPDTPAPQSDVTGADAVSDTVSPNDTAETLDVPSDVLGDVDALGDTAVLEDALSPDTTPDPAVTVSFSVVIPEETPAAATVNLWVDTLSEPVVLDCGAATTHCEATFAYRGPSATTWSLALAVGEDTLYALDLQGEPIAEHSTFIAGETFSLSDRVERWGDRLGASAHALAFLVRVPATTPQDEPLFVSGGAPALGDWDGRGLLLELARNGAYSAVVEIEGVRSVSFKITRGSWYMVEKNADFSEIEDRRSDLGGGLRRVEVAVSAFADLALAGTGSYTGDVRVLRGVPSVALDNARDIYVWLPPGYREAASTHYPVMYLHDGQNTLDAGSAAFGVEWRADETLAELIDAGTIPPMIVVAIPNTPDRIAEYTPSVDVTYGGGNAAAYGRFLVDEVIPLINAQYRTETGAAATGLGGSSLGGLVTLWLGLTYPEVFGRLAVVSPSVWWDDRMILATVAGYTGPATARIWLDIGTSEGVNSVANTRDLRDALVLRGWELNTNLVYGEYEDAGHNESAWAERFGRVMTSLWAP